MTPAFKDDPRKRDKLTALWKSRKAEGSDATIANSKHTVTPQLAFPQSEVKPSSSENIIGADTREDEPKDHALVTQDGTRVHAQAIDVIQSNEKTFPIETTHPTGSSPSPLNAKPKDKTTVDPLSVTTSDPAQFKTSKDVQCAPGIQFLTPSAGGTLSDRLWQRAYSTLRTQEAGIAQALEAFLLSCQETIKGTNGLATAVYTTLEARDARQWAIDIAGKKIKIREQAEKIVKFILWSSDYISAAVSSQPYASLAWTSVTLLLPLVLNHTEQNQAMMEGLAYIVDLLPIYKVRENLYLLNRPDNEELSTRIVTVYANILAYHGRVIVYFGRNSASNFARDIMKADSWVDWQAQIKKSDKQCMGYIGEINKQQEAHQWAELFAQFQKKSTADAELLKAVHEVGVSQQRAFINQETRECLECLSSKYEEYKNLNPERVDGTCEWFLQNPRFLEWRNQKTSALLWVTADPGCGKSVLSRYLIDENVLGSSKTASTVGHFFFKDGLEGRTQPFNALSAILHNILTSINGPHLIKHALPSFECHGKKLSSMFQELWKMLLNIAQDESAGEIICVIDALDECEAAARAVFIDELVKFYIQGDLAKRLDIRLKFLITSRPYPEIADRFDRLELASSFVRFDGMEETDLISKDINLVINVRVPQVARHASAPVQQEIIRQLKQFEHRTYLWLYLMLNVIETNIKNYNTKGRAADLIHRLPTSINDAYTAIVNHTTDSDRAAAILRIIVAAHRPLTLAELNIATEISLRLNDDDCDSHNALDCNPHDSFRSSLLSICGLFVTVYDSKAYLIHQTAREFLLVQFHTRKNEFYNFTESAAQYLLARICTKYLYFRQRNDDSDSQELNDDSNRQDAPGTDPDTSELDSRQSEHTLGEYAALNWANHARSSAAGEGDELWTIALTLCIDAEKSPKQWFQTFCGRNFLNKQGWSSLGIASISGLDIVAATCLQQGENVDAQAGYYGTALQAASSEGYDKIVEMLLSKNANVNLEGGKYGTALQAASYNGHDKIVEMLLSKNADVDLTGGYYGTALQAASYNGHDKIVEMLLSKNANVDLEGGEYGTALQAASSEGYDKIVKMLLSKNANVDRTGGYYGTALQAASFEGHDKIVEMLLSKNANVDRTGGYYGTALQAASCNGHDKIVEMLLSKNANVDLTGGKYGTALQAASYNGHDKIVEMLLSKNANVDRTGGYYGTALYTASYNGHDKIVETLLSKNANVDLESGYYGTALQAASYNGHDKIVEMLLSKNANVNLEGGKYGTALYAASSEGNDKVVEMLLSKNANVNLEGGEYGTALQAASSEGHDKIVEMLLSKNANVNLEGGKYGTALYAASSEGNDKVVEMLLSKNANVDLTGGKYGTALQAASYNGHDKIVEMLLSKNANVNLEGGEYGTALQVASYNGHDKIVEMLLSKNANVDRTGGYYGTALYTASYNGHDKIVEMLLSKNANVNLEGGEYGTALQVASYNGHDKIVEMLLSKNANVDRTGGYYGTALQAASCNGHDKIVEMLLSKNANVDLTGGKYGTALQAASYNGHDKIVEMLLSKNANVNLEGGEYGTALQVASYNGHDKIVEMLLSKNANVDRTGGYYGTALQAASFEGHDKIVEMLLSKNANVNLEGGYYGTALQVASYNGHDKIVEMLLSKNAK